MIKLIATDMDGTLLNSNKEITENTYNIIQKILDRNIIFVAISGRSLNNIKYAFNKFHDDIVFAGDNGAQIKYPNQEREVMELDFNIVSEVVKIALENEINFSLNGLEYTYIFKRTDEIYKKVLNSFGIFPIEIIDLQDIQEKIVKITIYEPKGSEEYALHLFKNIPNSLVIVSGDIWLDISNENCNKGEALKRILNKYNIKKDECIVFGDHLNDESLFKNAGTSYAMKNAHPKLKEIANKICEYTNDEEGVYHQLVYILKEM